MEAIGIIIFIIVMVAICKSGDAERQRKMDNIDPLNVDTLKMTTDRLNGVSQKEIERRYGNGYYNQQKEI